MLVDHGELSRTPSSTINTSEMPTCPQIPLSIPVKPSRCGFKRKRLQGHSGNPKPGGSTYTPLQEDEPSRKFQCYSSEDRRCGKALVPQSPDIRDGDTDPVSRWVQGKPWPKEFFVYQGTMNPLLNSKSSSCPPHKISETSDQSLRECKNPAVRNRLYEKILETAEIHMGGGPGITDSCQALCKSLLESKQTIPADSLFHGDRYKKTCERLRNENETKVIRDISPLLVPSAELLYAFGEEHLESMIDHVNQKWYGCIPMVTGPVPQPDYSAGCKQSVFTKDQLLKLEPFVKGWKGTPFLATAWMFFPFLTLEVKCGNEGLNIADRHNAHSSAVAVKQVVDLYRAVSRQKDLNRKILAFSVSHDQEVVKIYGHYPVIDGKHTSVYRHSITKFDITNDNGKDKWTAYKFTRNIYDIFVPQHLERLRSAIDKLAIPSSPRHQLQKQRLGLLSP